MCFFLFMPVDVISCLSSCLDFSTIMKFNLDLKTKINSFYPNLLFLQLYYQSNRSKTEHLLNLRFLRKNFLFIYTLYRLYVVMKKEGKELFYILYALSQTTHHVLRKHVHVNESIGEVYSIEICLAVLRASYHYSAYVNNCRGPHHLSIDAT